MKKKKANFVLMQLITMLIIFSCVGTPQVSSDQEKVEPLPPGVNIFPGNGNRFEVVNEAMHYIDAAEEAERRGGHLATITSREKNDFVLGLLLRDGTKKNYWLGGGSSGVPGLNSWVTGEPVDFTNWHVALPSNLRPMGTSFVVVMSRVSEGDLKPGQWFSVINDPRVRDREFTDDYGFVIEYPARLPVPFETDSRLGSRDFLERFVRGNESTQNFTIFSHSTRDNNAFRSSYEIVTTEKNTRITWYHSYNVTGPYHVIESVEKQGRKLIITKLFISRAMNSQALSNRTVYVQVDRADIIGVTEVEVITIPYTERVSN